MAGEIFKYEHLKRSGVAARGISVSETSINPCAKQKAPRPCLIQAHELVA